MSWADVALLLLLLVCITKTIHRIVILHKKITKMTHQIIHIVMQLKSKWEIENFSYVNWWWVFVVVVRIEKNNEPVGWMFECKMIQENSKYYVPNTLILFVFKHTIHIHINNNKSIPNMMSTADTAHRCLPISCFFFYFHCKIFNEHIIN